MSVLPPRPDVTISLINAIAANTEALDRLAATLERQSPVQVRPPGYPQEHGTR